MVLILDGLQRRLHCFVAVGATLRQVKNPTAAHVSGLDSGPCGLAPGFYGRWQRVASRSLSRLQLTLQSQRPNLLFRF